MYHKALLLFLSVTATAFILSPSSSLAAHKMVYIVHSYEKNHVCGQPQEDGVLQVLRDAGLYPGQVSVRIFYMDTKKTNTSAEAMDRVASQALKDIFESRPDVVVTLDDNAFRLVGLKLVDHPDIHVVFSGMNGQPETYNQSLPFMENRDRPGHNVTGIYEKLHLKRALLVFDKALPTVTKVVGITDYSPTGEAITVQFALEESEGLPVEWHVERARDFETYKQIIHRLNADETVQAIYPAALTLETKDGGRVTAKEIFTWTVENSTKPEIALNYFFSRLGLFGGAAVDFKSMGMQAGKYAALILQGEKAGELPIVDARDYAIVFNMDRARMLDVTIPGKILLAADEVYKDILLTKK